MAAVKPRAALYHRVSTLDQDAAGARLELRRAAAQRGMRVVLEEHETGSGATSTRPGLSRVLEAARRGRVDAVLCWKLDRFGRSVIDLLANVRALRDAGVRFIAITQGIDLGATRDATSELLLTMLAAVAEFERDLIRERTMLGLERARAAGRRPGRPREADVDAARARALKRQGRTWSEIAKLLSCSVPQARRAAARRK